MALVVENGTGIANANTYVSEADSETLLQAHPKADQWCAASTNEKEIALRAATMYLDRRFRFYGNTSGTVQALQWPRTRNFDTHGHEIVTGTIPTELKQAQSEIAVELFCDPTLSVTTIDEAGTITNWSTDGVSVTFSAESGIALAVTGKRFPGVEFLVKSFAVLRDAEDLGTFKLETQVTL
jgi:hypothetical protein